MHMGLRSAAGAAFIVSLGLGWLATPAEVAARDGLSQFERRAQARVELGRRLFYDPAVSQRGETSCAKCHNAAVGFADPHQLSADEVGITTRHSQVLLDAKFNPSAHWDGAFDHIEGAILQRLGIRPTSASEYYGSRAPTQPLAKKPPPVSRATVPPMGDLIDASSRLLRIVPAKLKRGERYKEAFRAAYGSTDVSLPKIARAIADYCRTIESTESPFDRFLAGDTDAISQSATRGYALFRGRAGCAQCHTDTVDKVAHKVMFTDYDYRNTGIAALRRSRSRRFGASTSIGRMGVTGRRADLSCFKTPSLRDVATSAPYMHDGSIKTLEEVVRYYAKGCNAKSHNLDKRIKRFGASETDIEDLVSFLKSLSGIEPAGRAAAPWSKRAETITLQVLRNDKPVPNLQLVLEGVGEFWAGVSEPLRLTLKTDALGRAEFTPGPFTHMRVVTPAMPIEKSIPWIPDTARRVVIDLK